MPPTVVILTKLPGHLPVKTRLVPLLGEEGARALYVEMVRSTVRLALAITPRPVLAYSPPRADPREALEGIEACALLPTPGKDGAQCLEYALEKAYRGEVLLALGGDAPDLPRERLRAVVQGLDTHDAVFVPTGDGGFSCLGLRRPVPGLAAGFAYGKADALARLQAFLVDRKLVVATLAPWPDVDTPEGLRAWRKRISRPPQG